MLVEEIREAYPIGCRVALIKDMEGERLKAGYEGTVKFVDDAGQVHVKWDCGSSLALILGVDTFRKVY